MKKIVLLFAVLGFSIVTVEKVAFADNDQTSGANCRTVKKIR
ncbi:hypothetical protein [Lactococcus allomyrinae]|nr:hypothetical protein [Lactococcus allomyrinae]